MDKSSSARSDTDDFWDISDLLPQKSKRYDAPLTDVSTVLVEFGGKSEQQEEGIPEKENDGAAESLPCVEYDGEGALCHVKISPWPTNFSFYSRFKATAEKLWRKKHAKCESVAFFSYMPLYEQMTSDQLMYYLYWRDRVRHGEYIHADYSYILLYLYEIINLPHVISPKFGAALIARVWAAYRKTYMHLDKYAGEWLADYCLIHRIPIPYDIVAPIFSDAAKSLTLAELYTDIKTASYDLIKACSLYDYKKSKYYGANRAVYDEHIKKAAEIGARVYFGGDIYETIRPIRVSRDSFSWAVASYDVKFKMEISYRPLTKNHAVRDAATAIIKYCENNVRAALGIKSRFSKIVLPQDVERAINGYFDAVYPDRYVKKKKRPEEEDYLKFYEPDASGTADIARAMQIEHDAWQTAIDLDADNIVFEENDISQSEITAIQKESADAGDEFGAFVLALTPELRAILKAAAGGNFTAECAKQNVLPTEAERIINETSYDTVGDAVISNGKITDDYFEQIISAINENGG